jgi:hypothetical protein
MKQELGSEKPEQKRAAAAARNRFVPCGSKQALGSEKEKQSETLVP